MIIDEQVLPLQRIWCLFEVYHTIRLSCSSDHFQGASLGGTVCFCKFLWCNGVQLMLTLDL